MRFAKVLVGAGVCLGLLGSVTSAVAQPAPAAGGPTEVPSNIKIVPPIVLRPLIKVHHAVLHWQETPQWCWAASGQMVMEEAGTRTVPQCYEANQALGRTDCCSCPTPAACVQPGWPQWSTWGFNNKTANPLSWAELVAKIDAGKPFAFAWGWNGGGGHMMVVRGYAVNLLLGDSVYVDNPWGPKGRCGPGGNASGPFGGDFEYISYADFLGGPGYDHVFWGADYDVTPK